mmetsp:Transcript_2499/g.2835  ORF Transcript_2499/g.2835 Transcript_2499/m.2835 type:complete len:86 (+) Transcript_2499:1392-1649(+)
MQKDALRTGAKELTIDRKIGGFALTIVLHQKVFVLQRKLRKEYSSEIHLYATMSLSILRFLTIVQLDAQLLNNSDSTCSPVNRHK